MSKLEQAINAIKNGEKEQGKKLLIEILRADSNNERAWLWMSAAVEPIDQRQECLEKVLEINPNNQSAQNSLASLKRKREKKALESSTKAFYNSATTSTPKDSQKQDAQPSKKEKELLQLKELISYELSQVASRRVLIAQYVRKGFPKEAVENLVNETNSKLQPPDDNMSLSQLLFSPEGRIPRSTYWLYYLANIAIFLPLAFIFVFLFGAEENPEVMIVYYAIGMILSIPWIFVTIKRCHDRDRSGWFLLLQAIPFVNIWVAIELWFLKGTSGPNQYGSDPTRHNRQREVRKY